MKYGIIGINGRMGKEIQALFDEKGHELVFSYDINGEWKKEIPEVIIDFSLPEALNETIKYTTSFVKPLIIGTTGLNEQQFDRLRELSQSVPVIQSGNYSIGIQMLLKATELLKNHLPDWDVEITETHHRFKKDKPSGTALMISDVFNRDVNTTSLRLGNVPGDHTVYFGGLGETISVSHRALSRRTFSEGVLKSAEFVLDKERGYFTFKDVLFAE